MAGSGAAAIMACWPAAIVAEAICHARAAQLLYGKGQHALPPVSVVISWRIRTFERTFLLQPVLCVGTHPYGCVPILPTKAGIHR
jgi:hypothetical protein